MQTYDLFMLIVLAGATIFGAIKGFAWQVASLASIIVSYIVALTFRGQVASMINAQEPWNMFISMLLLYSGSSFVIWMVFRMVSTSIDKIKLRDFDRQLGAGLGLLKGALLCLLITMFAMSLSPQAQKQRIANSRSGYYISRILASSEGVLPSEVKGVVGPYITGIEQSLEQNRGMLPAGNDGFDNAGQFIENKLTELGREAWQNGTSGLGQGGNGQSGGGFFGQGQGGGQASGLPLPWNSPSTNPPPANPPQLGWPNNNTPAPANGFGQPQNYQPQPTWPNNNAPAWNANSNGNAGNGNLR